jgi:hypothetical protein
MDRMRIPETTIDWLLEGDPAIRWQTKRDLLGSGDYTADRTAIAASGWGKQLLDEQDSAGTWAGGLYSPKWTSTTYTLLLLYRCGLEPGTPAALRGVELLWEGANYYDGGLTPAKTVSGAEVCVTAMYVALARYFGYDDARVATAEQWLLANQLEDGGWNCENVRSGHQHSSFHTSISTMEALVEMDRSRPGRPEVAAALDRGREFFLAHHLYKSHRDGGVANPVFTQLSFPPRWHYDILRGLDHFQAVAAPPDQRFADAIAVLQGKRRSDGLWPVQHKHAGRVWFNMETGRNPSRWNTLRALRVLRWFESG